MQKKGRWAPEEIVNLIRDYEEYQAGKLSRGQLVRLYNRDYAGIAFKYHYITGNVNKGLKRVIKVGKRKYMKSGNYSKKGSGLGSNVPSDVNAEAVIALLKNANLGRGWRSKVRAVINPITHIKWDKSVATRAVPILASEGEVRLVRTKKGGITVYSVEGYKLMKKGREAGIKAMHKSRKVAA